MHMSQDTCTSWWQGFIAQKWSHILGVMPLLVKTSVCQNKVISFVYRPRSPIRSPPKLSLVFWGGLGTLTNMAIKSSILIHHWADKYGIEHTHIPEVWCHFCRHCAAGGALAAVPYIFCWLENHGFSNVGHDKNIVRWNYAPNDAKKPKHISQTVMYMLL